MKVKHLTILSCQTLDLTFWTDITMDSRLPKRRVVFGSLAGWSANIFTRPKTIPDHRMLWLVGAVPVFLRDNVSGTHVEDLEIS